MHFKNVSDIHSLPEKELGMDVIIISVDSPQQIRYWERRLESRKDLIFKKSALICCIQESWPGGAGNGLGSLFAYLEAKKKILERDLVDISKLLSEGAAVAIYHTAGKGKRLFPLTGSECSNKAAVKLPSIVDGKFLSILEGVIKQTGIFAPVRKGRLSVFWSDQIFIPSKAIDVPSNAHIDILAIVRDMPSEKEWEEEKLYNYGLLTIDNLRGVKDVEKCEYSTIKKLIVDGKIAVGASVGMSLGSFSLSKEMLEALLDEFSKEICDKSKKMDSDPFIWMPLTLDQNMYREAMVGKELSQEELDRHYMRMQKFKSQFLAKFGGNLFGVVDVGKESYWWDYGTVASYLRNNLKIAKNDPEAQVMRAFFQLKGPVHESLIEESDIHESVVVGVQAKKLKVSNSLIINSSLESFVGDDCLLYNVTESAPLAYSKGTVRADSYIKASKEQIKMLTHKDRDGKQDFEKILPKNSYTYAELQALTRQLDPGDSA